MRGRRTLGLARVDLEDAAAVDRKVVRVPARDLALAEDKRVLRRRRDVGPAGLGRRVRIVLAPVARRMRRIDPPRLERRRHVDGRRTPVPIGPRARRARRAGRRAEAAVVVLGVVLEPLARRADVPVAQVEALLERREERLELGRDGLAVVGRGEALVDGLLVLEVGVELGRGEAVAGGGVILGAREWVAGGVGRRACSPAGLDERRGRGRPRAKADEDARLGGRTMVRVVLGVSLRVSTTSDGRRKPAALEDRTCCMSISSRKVYAALSPGSGLGGSLHASGAPSATVSLSIEHPREARQAARRTGDAQVRRAARRQRRGVWARYRGRQIAPHAVHRRSSSACGRWMSPRGDAAVHAVSLLEAMHRKLQRRMNERRCRSSRQRGSAAATLRSYGLPSSLSSRAVLSASLPQLAASKLGHARVRGLR